VAALLLAVLFLAADMYIASKRLFWHDEIATVLVARLPSLSVMWRALVGGADLLPVPYYAIVRVSEWLFGPGEFAARFPSAIALAAGMLFTFDCARRLTNGLHGLIAQAILTCSFLPFYGYEARPYGLYFMFAALSLWLWLSTAEESRPAACAFGAVVLLGTAVHYYFIICLVPYAVYEVVRWRMPSPKMIAGVVGAGFALLLLAPQILVGRRAGSGGFWWAPPSLARLQFIIPEFFPTGLFLLAMIMVWISLTAGRQSATVPGMSEGERLSWFFLLIPVAGLALAYLVTHSFHNRYFMGMLPGIAVGLSALLDRQLGGSWRASGMVMVFFLASGLVHLASKVRHPELVEPAAKTVGEQELTRQMLAWEDAIFQDGKKYSAIHSIEVLWLEAWYYSKHRERYVVLLDDPRRGTWALSAYYSPLKFWTIDDLKAHARETAMVVPGADFLQTLKDAGLRGSVRSSAPLEIIYLE
jgi:hypothetical protein